MILIVKAWTEKCEHEFLTNPTENKLIKKLQTSYSDKTWMLPWSIRNSGLWDLPEEVLSREVTSWNSKLPFIIKTCLIKLAVKGLAHISWKHFWILWLCCTCLKGTCCLLLAAQVVWGASTDLVQRAFSQLQFHALCTCQHLARVWEVVLLLSDSGQCSIPKNYNECALSVM